MRRLHLCKSRSILDRHRSDFALAFSDMSEPLQYLTDEHGERTAVVLPISEYEKLLQDLADLAVVAERRNEPVVPHAQFVSELKRDGIL